MRDVIFEETDPQTAEDPEAHVVGETRADSGAPSEQEDPGTNDGACANLDRGGFGTSDAPDFVLSEPLHLPDDAIEQVLEEEESEGSDYGPVFSDPYDAIRARMEALQSLLSQELLNCEVKWGLFVAAVFSYRWRKLLTDMPPGFYSYSEMRGIDYLVDTVTKVPPLTAMLDEIRNTYPQIIDEDSVDLLHWVLIENRTSWLRQVRYAHLVAFMEAIKGRMEDQKGVKVFEVVEEFSERPPTNQPPQPAPYNAYAFLGGPFDTFYSLLNGNYAHSRNGPAILTNNMEVAKRHSMHCSSMGMSSFHLGRQCLAVCAIDQRTTTIRAIDDDENEDTQLLFVRDANAIRPVYLVFFENMGPLTNARNGSVAAGAFPNCGSSISDESDSIFRFTKHRKSFRVRFVRLVEDGADLFRRAVRAVRKHL